MQANSDFTLLYPTEVEWGSFFGQRPMVPFAGEVVEYLNALSGRLLHDREAKWYPDVVTFAFFCRKGNVTRLAEEYATGERRLGRGVAFHIAPSNVPINFGYSLVAGLLAGNVNVVRVSSKEFPQVDLIVRHMAQLLPEYPVVGGRIALVRYDRTSEATAFFSSQCNVRVIWGGDATIATIRKQEIPPRAFDVCFADRYSLAVLRSSEVLKLDEAGLAKLAEAFYNDTYLFDQNACSAPHLVCWLGDSAAEAKDRFWTAVHRLAARKYALQPVLSVDKLTAFYRQAVAMDSLRVAMPDNLVVRTELAALPKDIDAFRCAGGYFSEYTLQGLDELAGIVNTKYQTLAHFGLSAQELEDFVLGNRLTGLDRLVPIGDTTAFSLTWDGWDLVRTLSRRVTVRG
jgi:hypothetical protein